MITIGTSFDRAAKVLELFDPSAQEAGHEPSRTLRVLHLQLSWASTDEEAMLNAVEHWPVGAMLFTKGDIRSPRVFEQIARQIEPDGFADRMLISSDPDAHRAHIQKFVDLGFDRIYLNNVGPIMSSSRSSARRYCRESVECDVHHFRCGCRYFLLPVSIGSDPSRTMIRAAFSPSSWGS